MKLLANENFPFKSVSYPTDHGFDITSIGIDYPGIKDHIVMQIAVDEKRTIVTFDRDYGALIFKHNYKPEKGVIYLRMDEYKADEPGKIVAGDVLEIELNQNQRKIRKTQLAQVVAQNKLQNFDECFTPSWPPPREDNVVSSPGEVWRGKLSAKGIVIIFGGDSRSGMTATPHD